MIEAAPEKIDLKLQLFAQIEQLAPAARGHRDEHVGAEHHRDGRIARSTPSRVAGMHFFNPVHKMKLVEIVRALESAPATLEAIEDVVAADGQGDGARARVARASSPRASTPASATRRSTC